MNPDITRRTVPVLPLSELLTVVRAGRRVVVIADTAHKAAEAFRLVRQYVIDDQILQAEMISRATNGLQSIFDQRRAGRVDFRLEPGLRGFGDVYDRAYLVEVPQPTDLLLESVAVCLFSAGDLEVVECRELVAR